MHQWVRLVMYCTKDKIDSCITVSMEVIMHSDRHQVIKTLKET